MINHGQPPLGKERRRAKEDREEKREGRGSEGSGPAPLISLSSPRHLSPVPTEPFLGNHLLSHSITRFDEAVRPSPPGADLQV